MTRLIDLVHACATNNHYRLGENASAWLLHMADRVTEFAEFTFNEVLPSGALRAKTVRGKPAIRARYEAISTKIAAGDLVTWTDINPLHVYSFFLVNNEVAEVQKWTGIVWSTCSSPDPKARAHAGLTPPSAGGGAHGSGEDLYEAELKRLAE